MLELEFINKEFCCLAVVPIQKVLLDGVQLWQRFFCLVDEERREDPNNNKSGPSWAHQHTFRWRDDDSPTWNAGLVA